MTLKADIDTLVTKFASDLEAIVRRAAVQAVTSALGGAAPAVAASGRAKPGPKPKAAAAKQGGKRVRRSPEQIKATADKIAAYVKANPGSNAEKIKKALGIAKNEWLAPLAVLMDGRRLASKGEKRDHLHRSLTSCRCPRASVARFPMQSAGDNVTLGEHAYV
jgi:hypothetical protein